jgi:hypothetical protein
VNGFGGMQPVAGVPKRFLEMGMPSTPRPAPTPVPVDSSMNAKVGTPVVGTGDVKMENAIAA